MKRKNMHPAYKRELKIPRNYLDNAGVLSIYLWIMLKNVRIFLKNSQLNLSRRKWNEYAEPRRKVQALMLKYMSYMNVTYYHFVSFFNPFGSRANA